MKIQKVLLFVILLLSTCALAGIAGAEEITNYALQAKYTINATTNVSMPVTIQFNDTSTGNPTGWNWSFGDGGANSTEQNPVHTYVAAGNYNVTFTVSNSGGSNTSVQRLGVAEGAPRNYSQHVNKMFQPDMGVWGLVTNMAVFWTTFVPASIFWIVILFIPYITMYSRQNGIIMVAIMYLFTGGIIAKVMPSMFAVFGFWFILFGATGVVYKMFIRD
jgi:hypothetical protein